MSQPGVIRYSYGGMSIYTLVWDPILYGGNLLWGGYTPISIT